MDNTDLHPNGALQPDLQKTDVGRSLDERRDLLNELVRENRVSYFAFGFTAGVVVMVIIYIIVGI